MIAMKAKKQEAKSTVMRLQGHYCLYEVMGSQGTHKSVRLVARMKVNAPNDKIPVHSKGIPVRMHST